MKHKIDIRGAIIPNDYKWFYDWWEEDSTCPRDVQKVIDAVQPGDEIEVYINSPGGVIDAGSEIYTLLRQQDNVKIFITGQACSAASIIAMAGHCSMTPTSLMMVHCVSTGARGNDAIMFEESEREILAAGHGFQLPSQEAMEKARKAMKETETSKDESVFILQQKLNFLKLKGEKR